ncbi:uncharacterized protein LOC128727687 [Anopheles nili]|uniref:uncharacterized protein LOC128727687 n=1 Tax=Anopheles nili TaxID=185578 RepID=UPI00237A1343|nr:uncharacterized protein LOC128727687 [Anopheles nili]
MKSSMAITKSAAFRFMLLLHLFLKVKMCVGFVDAAALSHAGDSDINYDDSDEWLGAMGKGHGEHVGSRVEAKRASGDDLLTWDAPPASSNGFLAWRNDRARLPHVRHERHYVRHRPHEVDLQDVVMEPGSFQAHTVTTSTVTGSERQEKSRHSQHHAKHHHHKHHRKPVLGSPRGEELSLLTTKHGSTVRWISQSDERRDLFDPASSRDASDAVSEAREAQDRQVILNRKRSASSFHSVASNSLTETGSNSRGPSVGGRVLKATQKSVNPQSKYYFEELLNNYKKKSPLYKEHQPRSPQTKALVLGTQKNHRSSSEGAKSVSKSKTPPNDSGDLDYLYDDESDGSVQNDAPSGGSVSTSTRAPTTSTTTTTTTTTPRSLLSFADSDESSGSGTSDGRSDGDTDYSKQIQTAYAMPKYPRKSGNNRYSSSSSIARLAPASSSDQQYRPPAGRSDRTDPAKQVNLPRQYETLTEFKQANFGSKDAVERSYTAYSNPIYAKKQADIHMNRIIKEGWCKIPKPKLVPASMDRTKVFKPHRTILHRCEDDTGCCMPPKTCVPKSTSVVQLYFYVSCVSSVRSRRPTKDEVVLLSFTNHTECHCADQQHHRSLFQDPVEQSSEGSKDDGDTATTNSCHCPRHFKSVSIEDSQCYCDCVSTDQECIRFKQGFESFSMETRKCIRSKKCTVPYCEYGMFNLHEGRCPKKSDRINEHFRFR